MLLRRTHRHRACSDPRRRDIHPDQHTHRYELPHDCADLVADPDNLAHRNFHADRYSHCHFHTLYFAYAFHPPNMDPVSHTKPNQPPTERDAVSHTDTLANAHGLADAESHAQCD